MSFSLPNLRYVQFFPTLRCNSACHFCFNRKVPMTGDLRINDFEQILTVLKDAGIRQIDILGGEPTLYTGLIQLMDMIKKFQLKATMSSNGTNIHALQVLSQKYTPEHLKIGMPHGGYIAGPSHDLMDIPLDTVILMRDLIKKHGIY